MKALIYKEFKLALHPICYIFLCLFPFMILIPSYPVGVGFIYILACYPILFLGANKGQQSNDLLYSVLQPVRKKDIVLARIITIVLMQAFFILLQSALIPLSILIQNSIASKSGQQTAAASVGFGFNGYVSTTAIAVVVLAITDLIFFPLYYRNGRSIVLATIFGILGFVLLMATFGVILPTVPGMEWYKNFFTQPIGIQFIFLFVGMGLSALIHFFIYKICSKQLEKVNF